MRPLEVVVLDVLPKLFLGLLKTPQRRFGQALLDQVGGQADGARPVHSGTGTPLEVAIAGLEAAEQKQCDLIILERHECDEFHARVGNARRSRVRHERNILSPL